MNTKSKQKILLIYDKECPACNFYCNIVRIRESIGELILVDAREHSAVMNDITERGWDIDQGMVLKVNDQLYYGTDAVYVLSTMGSQSDWFNRFNYWLFTSKSRSALLYPLLKSLRNLLLKILRKTKINNLNLENNHHF